MFYIDLETTVNGGPLMGSPEAHWKNNKVLLCGWCTSAGNITISTTIDSVCDKIQALISSGALPWVCAHNAKFDIKYLMRDRPDVEWHKVRVWDTMTYEYLASGHTKKFTSLVQACEARSLKMRKTIDLGALLATGVKMEDIPTGELRRYLASDVQGLFTLQRHQESDQYECDMDYLLPLCEMELNGLPIDRTKATGLAESLTKDVDIHFKDMCAWLKRQCQWQDGTSIIDDDFTELLGTKSKTIKPMSNRTLSFYCFGAPTELKITEKWRVRHKSNSSTPLWGSGVTTKVYGNKQPGAQGYPVGEDDLNRLLDVLRPTTHPPIITGMLNYRTKNKLLGTYIAPFLATSKVQGNIYPKLNTTVTNTGRLSSSSPNGQNLPPTARELIGPDNPDDEIVEIDFSQIEMSCAATLSGDPTMIKDLNKGVDLHFETGRRVMGWKTPSDMTKDQRTLVKNVNFGVLYGGKATGLSKQTGVDKKIVQSLIDSFYTRYPRVATWQKEVFEYVVNNMETYDVKEGEQRYAAMYNEPISGRRFRFVEAKSPQWLQRRTSRSFSFSPQHTANYPIQGFAGGDIVMSALHYLWVAIHSTGMSSKIKFRMTVHDSIVLQVRKGVKLNGVLDKMCEYVKVKYNLPVDLHYDVDTGDYWQ